MIKTDRKIYAPKIDPRILWKMSTEEFNDWREKNDYPRIIGFLKRKLPEFQCWMQEQQLTDENLIKHSPSTFLKKQTSIYIYEILDKEEKTKLILTYKKYAVGDAFFRNNLVKNRKDIIPYPNWYQRKFKKQPLEISVNMKQGPNHFILSELELLDLGNCHLSNQFVIGNRHLDFTNVSNLRLTNCMNNTIMKFWFCSAVNLTIEGDLAFIDAYKTNFYEIFNQKYNNLKLINGSFQRWKFEDCGVNISASNAILYVWEFNGWDFDGTISNSDIRECKFKNSPIQYKIDYGRVKLFHAHVKRLYSQLGKRKDASEHYFLERTYERKTFLHPKENYSRLFFNAKSKRAKLFLKIKYFFKYLLSGFLNVLWGYGEHPARVFGISIATIIVFASLYCYLPDASSETQNSIINSLYYSMVTFTTLGYGVNQPTEVLRFIVGIESLLGISFWGILIAGFTNNSKDY